MAAPPDTTSKALAVAACVFLALFLGVSAYFASGAAINDADFSVSQALAHGEPGSMIALLASAIAALASLIVYRAHPYTHPRVLIAVATGALLVVLMYPVADTGHYTIAEATAAANECIRLQATVAALVTVCRTRPGLSNRSVVQIRNHGLAPVQAQLRIITELAARTVPQSRAHDRVSSAVATCSAAKLYMEASV